MHHQTLTEEIDLLRMLCAEPARQFSLPYLLRDLASSLYVGRRLTLERERCAAKGYARIDHATANDIARYDSAVRF